MGEAPSAYERHRTKICCQERCETLGGHPASIAEVIIARETPFRQEVDALACLSSPGLTLQFLCTQPEYGTRSLLFTEAPLGITFKAESPIQVKDVQLGSLADRFGVQPDWLLASIDGEDVLQSDWNYVLRKVDALSSLLPPAVLSELLPQALQLDFEAVEGLATTVRCYKQPLGLWLAPATSNSPLGLLVASVSPNGHAEQLGIKKGWRLQKVCGRSVVGEDPQDVVDSISKLLSWTTLKARPKVVPKRRVRQSGELRHSGRQSLLSQSLLSEASTLVYSSASEA